MASEKRSGILGILITIGILFALFIGASIFIFKSLTGAKNIAENRLKRFNKGPIGVIYVKGIIMDSEKTIKKLLRAEEDKSLKAIVLRIDSPGGAVGPTQEIYEEVVRIDKKKPVYASFGAIAASGGYYLGAATRKIFASPGTLTGSIGVIMQFADLSKLYEWAKIKPEIIKAGKYKDTGSLARPMTGEERGRLEQMLSDVHEQFITDIQKRRGDKIKDIRAHTQGQIFSGQQGKKWGYVDELAGLWEAGRRIHKELGLKEEFGFKEIKERKKLNFFEFLKKVEEGASQLSLKLSKEDGPYYLYSR